MATASDPAPQTARPTDRQALMRLAKKISAQAGIVDDPDMTMAKLRELMKADGVRPEDNGASSELMRMRYGDDWDQE